MLQVGVTRMTPGIGGGPGFQNLFHFARDSSIGRLNIGFGDRFQEPKHRRFAWSEGSPTALTDGTLWRFPRIDLTLPLTNPHLPQDLFRALNLADDAQDQRD